MDQILRFRAGLSSDSGLDVNTEAERRLLSIIHFSDWHGVEHVCAYIEAQAALGGTILSEV